MIYYENRKLQFVLRVRGSVFPRAAFISLLAPLMSVIFQVSGTATWGGNVWNLEMYVAFSSVLGFLLAFRSNQAYARFWDGAETLRVAVKEWHDACCQLIAFTSMSECSTDDIDAFQYALVKLFSQMLCAALQQVANMADEEFDVLDLKGFDEETLRYLQSNALNPRQRADACFQWIMQLSCEAQATGIITVPAPILTRAFQELCDGTLHFEKMQTITQIPFPFPYAQMLLVLLMIHLPWTALTISASASISISGILAFLSVFLLWAMNFIAEEIEQPFGDDPNDLPIREVLEEMNENLLVLLQPIVQTTPRFEVHRGKSTNRRRCSTTLREAIEESVSLCGFSAIATGEESTSSVGPFPLRQTPQEDVEVAGATIPENSSPDHRAERKQSVRHSIQMDRNRHSIQFQGSPRSVPKPGALNRQATRSGLAGKRHSIPDDEDWVRQAENPGLHLGHHANLQLPASLQATIESVGETVGNAAKTVGNLPTQLEQSALRAEKLQEMHLQHLDALQRAASELLRMASTRGLVVRPDTTGIPEQREGEAVFKVVSPASVQVSSVQGSPQGTRPCLYANLANSLPSCEKSCH